MSRVERVDKHSGAILFKKDKDGKNLDMALEKIESLEKRIASLEKKVKSLSSK